MRCGDEKLAITELERLGNGHVRKVGGRQGWLWLQLCFRGGGGESSGQRHPSKSQRCVSDIRTLMRWPKKPTLSITGRVPQLEQPVNELCGSFLSSWNSMTKFPYMYMTDKSNKTK